MRPSGFPPGGRGRLVAEVLGARRRVQQRDRWRPDEVLEFQRSQLVSLRAFAGRHSVFYREHHRGVTAAPLSELPPITKATLMDRWDDVVTYPRLRLAGVSGWLASLEASDGSPAAPWRGRWWASATAGSTGRRAVFVWDRHEWVSVLTSYARVNDWAQVRVDLCHPDPTAIVSTRNPTHQSAVVGATLRNPLVPTLRLDSTRPIASVVEQLNAFQPRLLVCYASMLGPLAEEQLAGRLRIRPEKVVTASEELPEAARSLALHAWEVDIVTTYAATETATIASTCRRGSWHLFEDFVIIEPVDSDYRPVPDGEVADRLLVSVLFSRTLPLIRYELTDSVRLATTSCSCGLPFRCLDTVAGRTEDILTLPGRLVPSVLVRPNVFHDALESLAVNGWQIRQTDTGLEVLLVDPGRTLDPTQPATRVQEALRAVGVSDRINIAVRQLDEPHRTRLGKVRLIQGLPHRPADIAPAPPDHLR